MEMQQSCLLGFLVYMIISLTFPENFIEIRKGMTISLLNINIFIKFLYFLTFPCYKRTDDASV